MSLGVMRLKTGPQARHFRSSVFCGRKELLLVPTLTGSTCTTTHISLKMKKHNRFRLFLYPFNHLVTPHVYFPNTWEVPSPRAGSSWSVMEYYWWKYSAQKKQSSMIAGIKLDIVTRHYTSLRCLCGCWCGGLIVWAWTVHAWLPRGQWGKTLTGVNVMLRHSFLETEKSSPVSPPGCSSWQGSRNNDLWTPNGGRVSVTQLPEVSVNVSGREKRACCSWKHPPENRKKKKKNRKERK